MSLTTLRVVEARADGKCVVTLWSYQTPTHRRVGKPPRDTSKLLNSALLDLDIELPDDK